METPTAGNLEPVIGRAREADRTVFETPPRVTFYYFGAREGVNLGAGICLIPPGSSNQRHAHEEGDEVIYVLKGRLRFEFPGRSVILEPFEAVYIPRGLQHQIFNDGSEEAVHTFTFNVPELADRIRRKYR